MVADGGGLRQELHDVAARVEQVQRRLLRLEGQRDGVRVVQSGRLLRVGQKQRDDGVTGRDQLGHRVLVTCVHRDGGRLTATHLVTRHHLEEEKDGTSAIRL